jgi:serine protease Do
MSLDRRSFRLGVAAGMILLVGVIIGVVFTARMDGVPYALSEEAPRAPLAGPTPPNFVPVAKSIMPAVVNISTTRVVKSGGGGDEMNPFRDDPFFRHFFGDEFNRRFHVPRDRRENSLGSGVIVDPAGYIVTNNHVIAKADEIKVLLSDKRELIGKVVGTDPKSDIAVIKINGKNLPTAPWADSDKIEVGEYVLAIGNPFGLNQTVTMGIVSAIGRANVGIADYEDFIQTDAAINPGNSGGALVNARGELVGINTAIFSRSGGYMGVGFAVPSNMVKSVMQSLVKNGKVVRGWLGVSIQDVTPQLAKQFGLSEGGGALVNKVLPKSPAVDAGIRKGDVITAFNGKTVDSPGALRNVVAQTSVGTSVKVQLLRDKKAMSVEVKVAEQPKDLAKAGSDEDEESVQEDAKGGGVLSGLEVRNLTPDIARQLGLGSGAAGVVVNDVATGSPAEEAGVQQGDVIVEINREPVRNLNDYRKLSGKVGRKGEALLLINRRGNDLYIGIQPQ